MYFEKNSEKINGQILVTEIDPFFSNSACYVWRKKDCVYDPNGIISIVKHGGGSITIWETVLKET